MSRLGLGEGIDFALSQPTQAFGLYVVVNDGFNFFADDATLSAAGTTVGNPVVDPFDNDVNGVNAPFLGIVDDMAAFSAATIQFGSTPGNFGATLFEIDDIAYTTPVPIPAALPLFLAGLAALGLTGWRRRNTA